jgi:hypothetical protein
MDATSDKQKQNRSLINEFSVKASQLIKVCDYLLKQRPLEQQFQALRAEMGEYLKEKLSQGLEIIAGRMPFGLHEGRLSIEIAHYILSNGANYSLFPLQMTRDLRIL